MGRTISHLVNLLTYSWQTVGPLTMARNSLRWVRDREARNVDSGFDSRYGTDTNTHLTPREARIPALRRAAATMYLPTMDQDLEAMLTALAWPAALTRQSTFVDMGSGKGRVVCLAAMRRFREVVGVELSPVLHEVANSNVDLVRASGDLVSPTKLVLGDATSFEAPGGSLVVYMYHPFGPSIAHPVVQQLCASIHRAPRPAAILYCHPTLQTALPRELFESSGVFSRSANGARRTKRFELAWSVFTNHAWMGRQ